MDEFLKKFDEASLAEFQKPHGQKMQRVGKRATSIMRMARALASGKETIIESPVFPDHANYVMFDLEGLPPQFDELSKIYLWGMQVFGDQPGEYMPAVAGFGEKGDRQGWKGFLDQAASVFRQYGDIPFVHWASYEKTFLWGVCQAVRRP